MKSQTTEELLGSLRQHFHALHSAFLESLRYRYELEKNQPVNAYAWFNVITQDPNFQWIKPFNELVMDLDILIENKNATNDDLDVLIHEFKNLLTPVQNTQDFTARFLKLVVNDSDLLIRFHQFKTVYEKITAGPKSTTECLNRREKWRNENQINSRASAKSAKQN